VMSEAKAAWLARNFDLIGLSCDGPADIHDNQRPRWNGRSTLHTVERTAHIIKEEGASLHVRATITSATLHRQAEIASYLCQQFEPKEIHFEPVYLGGRSTIGFRPDQAEEFAHHLLEARLLAEQYGVFLESSGSRLDSIHGPYCNVFRQVLNLVPDDCSEELAVSDRARHASDLATACFKAGRATDVREKGLIIGYLDRRTARFEIDYRKVQTLRQQLATMPSQCAECFNRYHCVGDCPDRCRLDTIDLTTEEPKPGFRCRTQKAVAAAILARADEQLWQQVAAGKVQGPHGITVR
jgi:radical SAM protein with 4Fe4S-binding SPASM domain